MKSFLWALALLFGAGTLSLTPAPAQAGPILLISEGKLIGANDVDVRGTLYDVRFVDGTCVEVFSGCDSVSDFDFNNFMLARDAARALMDQVLLDSSLGDFDSLPYLTAGCSSSSNCFLQIPNGFWSVTRLQTGVAVNYAGSGDFGGTGSVDLPEDTSSISNEVWVRFGLPGAFDEVVEVPEPATLGLFGAGLLGLAAAGRRRRRGSANA